MKSIQPLRPPVAALLGALSLLGVLTAGREVEARRLPPRPSAPRPAVRPLSLAPLSTAPVGTAAISTVFQVSSGASNGIDKGLGFEFGDFNGLDFHDGRFHAAWGDNSAALAGNPDRPNMDVATAAVTVNPNGTRTVGPSVNVSAAAEYQAEPAVAINPVDPRNVVVLAVDLSVSAGLMKAVSTDGGVTWTTSVIATGTDTINGQDGLPQACCDPSVSFDRFGNCFASYLSFPDAGGTGIEVLVSSDNGAIFSHVTSLGGGDVDQPTVRTGPGGSPNAGSVWVTFKDFTADAGAGAILASGAEVTGLGAVGVFADQLAPGSADGNFGDIAVGPNGEVLITYQDNIASEGPSVIWTHLDPDGLGTASGFGAGVAVTTTNVGGFDVIPPQPGRTVDAEAGLAWDRSSGPNRGRLYLVYTDETSPENNDTQIVLRTSDDKGVTWTAPVLVNSGGASGNSQFFPRIALDQTTGSVAMTWYDGSQDGGTGSAVDTDGLPNTDVVVSGAFVIAPPNAPVLQSAVPQFGRKVRLTWTNVANEAGYTVQRSTGGSFSDIVNLGANVTSYDNSGLSPNTAYTYRIVAFNAGGGATSGSTTITTPDLPAVPTNLTANAFSGSQISLAWTDNATNELDYRLSRRTGTGPWSEFILPANRTSAVDSGLASGVTYTYRLRVRGTWDFSDYSNEASATTPTLPAPPSNLTAAIISGRQIRLTWQDNSSNETDFRLSRRVGSGSFVEVRNFPANTLTFIDGSVLPGTTYSYQIRAHNGAGFSAFSNIATETTPSPPAAPGNLTATPISDMRIVLTWADNSNNELSFRIARRVGAGNLNDIASMPPGSTTFTNTGLTPGTTYTYQVRAHNLAGFSPYSAPATATTLVPPAAPTNLQAVPTTIAGRVQLTWTDNSSDETGFRVERKTGSGNWIDLRTVGAPSYTDGGLISGQTYFYRVRSYGPGGFSAYTPEASVVAP
jgi:fibronectin type 3 domain-containing protein